MAITTLVFSGGGIRGISFIGVLKYLEQTNDLETDIQEVCCVSVGSIFGLFYILGMKSDEMEKLVMEKSFENLKNIRFMNLLSKWGLDSGSRIISWVEEILVSKGQKKDLTFKELHDLTGKTFTVVSTNLNKYTLTQFNHINTPDVQVKDAIRMSIGIPFLFTVTRYLGDIHVDGALISNYPIKLYHKLDEVLGVKLVSHGELDHHQVDEKIDTIESFIYHTLTCYIVQKEKTILKQEEYKKRTIFIHTDHVSQTINFALTKEQKELLIKIGYDHTLEYFKGLAK